MKILDTTLRDGSYVIDFKFTAVQTSQIVKSLEENGLELIEVGHGIGLGATEKKISPAVETDEAYAKATAESVKDAKWGMFCIPEIAELKHVEMCANYGMDFLRVGVDVNRIEKAEAFVKLAKQKNMYVALNFMKSYTAPANQFAKLVEIAQNYGADVAYLVDSAGNMTPNQIEEYFNVVKAKTNMPLAFHGHNNLGLATANALKAYECGAEIIDASLQGMGRGTGNTPLEHFVALLDKLDVTHRFNLIGLMDAAEELVRPHLTTTGLDTVDIACGWAGFHSSYMGVIKKYAMEYDIDPRKLIIEVCKENQLDAPAVLVEEKAKILKARAKKTGWKHKFNLGKYFGEEQSKVV